MDFSLVHHLNGFLLHHDTVEDPVSAYMSAAELLFLGMLIVAFVVVGGHRRRDAQRAVVAAGLSAGVALAIASVMARLIDRPRPFVGHPGSVHLFVHHATDPGFPSDHATAAFAIAVALLLRFRAWGVVTLIAAVLLAVGRVAIGVHYPTDVLAGAALGSAVALAFHTPRVRALLNRLADAVGGVLDGVLRGIASRAGVGAGARG
ncbi:MAG: phosphatase PAP2 family protein [Solirubrobacteraceae bacterium]